MKGEMITRKQLIQEYGWPKTFVDRILHCEWAPMFCQKMTRDGKTSKFMIEKDKVFRMREEGYFR